MTGPESRRVRPFVIAGAVLLGTAHAAAAAGPQGGWYLGLTAIGAYATMDDFKTDGFAGPAIIEHDDDWVAGLAFKAGYSWREIPVRAELELSHRYRFDLDVKQQAPGALIDYEGNVGTTSLLFTGILEWRNSSAFRPFVGLTLGWAHHFTDTERTNLLTGEQRGRDRRQDNFAWGGVVGVDWDFAQRWSAEAAYRYINLGKVTTGTLFTGERIEGEDYVSHDLLLSILYRFN